MLYKIISGAQTGADIAGLKAAKKFDYETGGFMPKGFKTTDGAKPEWAEEFGLREGAKENYASRTFINVKISNATIRFAHNWKSAGEVCTLKAINIFKKPHFDINLEEPCTIKETMAWVIDNGIGILNIAGHSEKSYKGTEDIVFKYLVKLFQRMEGKCYI